MQNMIILADGYMPLIDFNQTFFFQIFNFLVLFYFLNKLLFKPFSKVLEERKSNIANSYDEADMAMEEAKKLKQVYESKIAEAKSERDEIIAKARESANKQSQDIVRKAEEESRIIKENAEKQIEADRQKAMASVKNEIASMAILAAAKILKKEVDNKTNREMISEFIDGVGDVEWNK